MKNILLFMTDFYGYNSDIIHEIEKQNCTVKWYQDKVNFSFFERLLSKIFKNYKRKKFNKYFFEIIQKEKDNLYDEILIVFGAGFMDATHLSILKNTFLNAKIVYYAWDSVANFPSIKSLFEGADIAYSFDKNDCLQYGVKFLPLFYVEDNNVPKNVKWDVSTIMSFYNKKSLDLKKLFNILPNDLKKFFYLRLRSKEYFFYMKFVHPDNFNLFRKYFAFNSLDRNECLSIINESIAVVDCPIPNQNGLTMRTFETLAMNTKLITSNINVREYDFYTPNNIYVVDSNSGEIPMSFFTTPFDMDFKISTKYHIKNFIKELIQ